MYSLRKRKTLPEKDPEPTSPQKRTSTGKRRRPKATQPAQPQPTLPPAHEPQPQPPIIPKPKPKKKQSQYQLSRIKRAQNQRMYLLHAQQLSPNNWYFTVRGYSGSDYQVNVNRSLFCGCFDFRRNHRPCKHLYFIVCQVAQFNELLEKLPNSINMSLTNLELLSTMLRDRLGARLKPREEEKKKEGEQEEGAGEAEEEGEKKKEKLPEGEDCAICFEELEENEGLKQCGQCKKYIHTQCLKAWLTKNSTCPLCRFDMSQIFGPKPASIFPSIPFFSPPVNNVDLTGLDPTHPLYQLQRVHLLTE